MQVTVYYSFLFEFIINYTAKLRLTTISTRRDYQYFYVKAKASQYKTDDSIERQRSPLALRFRRNRSD